MSKHAANSNVRRLEPLYMITKSRSYRNLHLFPSITEKEQKSKVTQVIKQQLVEFGRHVTNSTISSDVL